MSWAMLFISSYLLSQQVWLMAFDNSDALYIWGVLYYLSLTVTNLQHTHLIVEDQHTVHICQE